jgi:hypothetical protein
MAPKEHAQVGKIDQRSVGRKSLNERAFRVVDMSDSDALSTMRAR